MDINRVQKQDYGVHIHTFLLKTLMINHATNLQPNMNNMIFPNQCGKNTFALMLYRENI